jgi:hypothetical protein
MKEDYRIWNDAIRLITSPQLRLQQPLVDFISLPHTQNTWLCDEACTSLVQRVASGTFALYLPSSTFRHTRSVSGIPFTFHRFTSRDPGLTHMATVFQFDHPLVRLHSCSAPPRFLEPPTQFLQVLASWENQSLWKHLKCDGDGSWVLDAIIAGSLDIVHDGSYMKKVAPKVCSISMALIMRCRNTDQELTCTWVELSASADNYRGELLGGLCCSLLLIKQPPCPPASIRNSRFSDIATIWG